MDLSINNNDNNNNINESAKDAYSQRKVQVCSRHPEMFLEPFCQDCEQYLCWKCVVAQHARHTILPVDCPDKAPTSAKSGYTASAAVKMNSRAPIPPRTASWTCPIHKDRGDDLCCVDCKRIICWKCAVGEHSKHSIFHVEEGHSTSR